MIWLWRTACFDFRVNSIHNHSAVSGAAATAANRRDADGDAVVRDATWARRPWQRTPAGNGDLDGPGVLPGSGAPTSSSGVAGIGYHFPNASSELRTTCVPCDEQNLAE